MSEEMTSNVSFSTAEMAGVFYLATMGLASMMRNSSEEMEKKDAEIMYLSAAMGIKDLPADGFSDSLKKLDEMRNVVIGN